jgi:hypothetical protein
MPINKHEVTNKQFMAAAMDSSGKHLETILKPKGMIHKQLSCNYLEITNMSNNHLATIINSTTVNQKISAGTNKKQ